MRMNWPWTFALLLLLSVHRKVDAFSMLDPRAGMRPSSSAIGILRPRLPSRLNDSNNKKKEDLERIIIDREEDLPEDVQAELVENQPSELAIMKEVRSSHAKHTAKHVKGSASNVFFSHTLLFIYLYFVLAFGHQRTYVHSGNRNRVLFRCKHTSGTWMVGKLHWHTGDRNIYRTIEILA